MALIAEAGRRNPRSIVRIINRIKVAVEVGKLDEKNYEPLALLLHLAMDEPRYRPFVLMLDTPLGQKERGQTIGGRIAEILGNISTESKETFLRFSDPGTEIKGIGEARLAESAKILTDNPHLLNLLSTEIGRKWLSDDDNCRSNAGEAVKTTQGEVHSDDNVSDSKDVNKIIRALQQSMVKIPSGTFQMGGEGSDNEQPIHEVKVPEFWMLSTPVTQAQWQAVMGTDPSTFKGPERPVENVSWNDAKKFCDKLSAHTRETYRLSSEAEWEYACRAGSNDRYCFGNDENILGDYAWYDKNSKGETHPVAQKEPNNFNLYDMHGNVWEWCEDTWHDNYKDAPRDGSAWVSEDEPGRVVRGASWDSSNPRDLRSSSRVRYGADSGSLFIGFRCVRSSH